MAYKNECDSHNMDIISVVSAVAEFDLNRNLTLISKLKHVVRRGGDMEMHLISSKWKVAELK